VQGAPKLQDEKLISVGDDLEGEAIFTIPIVEKDDCELFSRYVSTCGDDSYVRVETIGNGKDAVKTIVGR